MKKIIPLFLVLTLLFSLSACGLFSKDNDDPQTFNIPKNSSETEEPITYRHPLTGELLNEKPENLRPYAIMINNISYAQPHCGVSQADIIYEVLAEGEITRMLAIFSALNDVGPIGSMRSARPYYIDISNTYDAIFIHAGGSEQAYSDISTKSVDTMDGVRGQYAEEIFYRDPSRQQHGIEHSMFTTGSKLLEYTDILGYNTQHSTPDYDYGLEFSDEVDMPEASAAQTVNVSFSGLKDTSFDYNSDGHYTASQFGNTYIDGNSNKAIEFKNVLVLFAETKVIDSEARRAVTLTGTGNGYFFCNGEQVDITWERDSDGGLFSYYLTDGTPLNLGVGKSYIGIVPTDSEITFS